METQHIDALREQVLENRVFVTKLLLVQPWTTI
jgi:hypothetical protein